MRREKAILALSELGCSEQEIAECIRIELLRRKAVKKTYKKANIADIVKHMEL
jgi:hypothetical protein